MAIYVLLAYSLESVRSPRFWQRAVLLLAGTLIGVGINFLGLDTKGRTPLLASPVIAPFGDLPVIDAQSYLMVLAAIPALLAIPEPALCRAESSLLAIHPVDNNGGILAVAPGDHDVHRSARSPSANPLGGNVWPGCSRASLPGSTCSSSRRWRSSASPHRDLRVCEDKVEAGRPRLGSSAPA